MQIKQNKPEPVPVTYDITLTQEELDVVSSALAWILSKSLFTDAAQDKGSAVYNAMAPFDSHPYSFRPTIKDARF